jgi:hypothetical protein
VMRRRSDIEISGSRSPSMSSQATEQVHLSGNNVGPFGRPLEAIAWQGLTVCRKDLHPAKEHCPFVMR